MGNIKWAVPSETVQSKSERSRKAKRGQKRKESEKGKRKGIRTILAGYIIVLTAFRPRVSRRSSAATTCSVQFRSVQAKQYRYFCFALSPEHMNSSLAPFSSTTHTLTLHPLHAIIHPMVKCTAGIGKRRLLFISALRPAGVRRAQDIVG